MNIFKTKYFDDIKINQNSDFEHITIKYKNNIINILFYNFNNHETKLKKCLNIIDKYFEIDKNIKKEIVKKYPENNILKNCIKSHFDWLGEKQLIDMFGTNKFKNINIKKYIEKLIYPDLVFELKNNKINITFEYLLDYTDLTLSVNIDEKINIINFEYDM